MLTNIAAKTVKGQYIFPQDCENVLDEFLKIYWMLDDVGRCVMKFDLNQTSHPTSSNISIVFLMLGVTLSRQLDTTCSNSIKMLSFKMTTNVTASKCFIALILCDILDDMETKRTKGRTRRRKGITITL